METYWTNFARTGNPNSASLPVWPAFDEAQSHMEFTEDGHASPSGKPLRGPQCSLLREALERQLKQARP
jgi:para-nitrobenzyl esterase